MQRSFTANTAPMPAKKDTIHASSAPCHEGSIEFPILPNHVWASDIAFLPMAFVGGHSMRINDVRMDKE